MSPHAAAGVVPWLGLFLAVIAVERISELALSARNAAKLRAAGAHELGARHFPLLVLVHVLFPVGLVAEVTALGAHPPGLWPFWLALWLGAQVLRGWAIRTLGVRWSVRIWVLRNTPAVRKGPYRFARHPNYVAVIAELFAGAMLFGAWRTAFVITILNALALLVRIPVEEAALRS